MAQNSLAPNNYVIVKMFSIHVYNLQQTYYTMERRMSPISYLDPLYSTRLLL